MSDFGDGIAKLIVNPETKEVHAILFTQGQGFAACAPDIPGIPSLDITGWWTCKGNLFSDVTCPKCKHLIRERVER